MHSTNTTIIEHCFTSTPCLSSSLLPSSCVIFYLSSTPDEDHVSKALVFLIVLYVSSYISEYISLEQFYLILLLTGLTRLRLLFAVLCPELWASSSLVCWRFVS